MSSGQRCNSSDGGLGDVSGPPGVDQASGCGSDRPAVGGPSSDADRVLHDWRAIREAAEFAAHQTASAGEAPLSSEGPGGDIEALRSELPGYRILEHIHDGGQGSVYKAIQLSTNRTVALKVLADVPLAGDRRRRRFRREIDVTSRLQHPNIVTIYESGIVHRRYYFAMEYVEGLSIDDYVLVEGLSARERVKLFVTVVRAVSSAHQHGIIHRDLKPSNILVDQAGCPRILDFGLAKLVDDAYADQSQDNVSIVGRVVGTMGYLSPEQASGLDEVDTRSDVFALGVVLFEILTGQYPYKFEIDSTGHRRRMICGRPARLADALDGDGWDGHPRPWEIDEDLEAVVAKSLEWDKEARFQSAAAFADDLERYLVGDAVSARADQHLYLLRKMVRRFRVHAAAAAALALMFVFSSVAVTVMWLRAKAERDNARSVAQLAHATLDQVVHDVDEAISPLAGGIKVRDRLLGQVDGNLARLTELVESDPALEALQPPLREKRGDIAFSLGRTTEATGHYEALLQLCHTDQDAGELNDEELDRLSRAYRKLAQVSSEPDDQLEKAVQVARILADRHPDSDSAQYGLCENLVAIGRHCYVAGRYEEAARHLAQALAIPAAASNESDPKWLSLRARAMEWNGEAQFKMGDGPGGFQLLEASLELRKRLSEQRAHEVGVRHDLMLSQCKLGDMYHNAERMERATSSYREAIALGRYLTQVEPGVAIWKRDLLGVHGRLAELYRRRGELDAAHSECQSALSLAEELIRLDPDDTRWRRLLAFSHIQRGGTRAAQDELQLAMEDFEAAIELRDQLARADSGDPEPEAELASAHDYAGYCSRELGDSERARRHYQRSFEIRTALLSEQPGVVERKLDVILSQSKLATWHLDQRTEADDAAAAGLLDEVQASLLDLESAGRLAGREAICAEHMSNVRHNRKLIEARRNKRSADAPLRPSDSSETTPEPGDPRDAVLETWRSFEAMVEQGESPASRGLRPPAR